MGGQAKWVLSPQMATFRCSEWSFFNIYITDILLLSPHVAMWGFVYSADADSRRDTCVFGRRVYSADGKFTIYIVDLVIFACLDFREFVDFLHLQSIKFAIFLISMISITRIIIIFAKSAKNKTSRILPGHWMSNLTSRLFSYTWGKKWRP